MARGSAIKTKIEALSDLIKQLRHEQREQGHLLEIRSAEVLRLTQRIEELQALLTQRPAQQPNPVPVPNTELIHRLNAELNRLRTDLEILRKEHQDNAAQLITARREREQAQNELNALRAKLSHCPQLRDNVHNAANNQGSSVELIALKGCKLCS